MRHHLLFGAAAAALVVPVAAYAQDTTSSIRGQVVIEGAPAANAEVTITHLPSNTTSTATTEENTGDRFSPKLSVGVTPIQGFQIYGTYALSLIHISEPRDS